MRTKASLAVTFNLFGTSFMIINSHFEGRDSENTFEYIGIYSLFLAGENVEGRANRKLNFQNTKTKITIPHEFIQRTCMLNKHSPTTSRVDSLKRAESSSSLDSALSPGAGRLNHASRQIFIEVSI